MLSTSWYVNDNINLNCLWLQLMIFNVCLSIPEQWRLPAVLWRWQTWSRREWRERDTPQSSLCVAPTAVEGAPLAYHSDHQRADRQIKHLHGRVELIEKRWVQSGWTTDEKLAHKTFSLLWMGLILLCPAHTMRFLSSRLLSSVWTTKDENLATAHIIRLHATALLTLCDVDQTTAKIRSTVVGPIRFFNRSNNSRIVASTKDGCRPRAHTARFYVFRCLYGRQKTKIA